MVWLNAIGEENEKSIRADLVWLLIQKSKQKHKLLSQWREAGNLQRQLMTLISTLCSESSPEVSAHNPWPHREPLSQLTLTWAQGGKSAPKYPISPPFSWVNIVRVQYLFEIVFAYRKDLPNSYHSHDFAVRPTLEKLFWICTHSNLGRNSWRRSSAGQHNVKAFLSHLLNIFGNSQLDFLGLAKQNLVSNLS